jgi:hypothetical protein
MTTLTTKSQPSGNAAAAAQAPAAPTKRPLFQPSDLKYLLAGALFGIVLVKAEVIAWYRIQEMFRFQSFHMYGVIGSAIVVGALSLAVLRTLRARSLDGQRIQVPPKRFHWGNLYGGIIFGLGWAMTGACPGPIFAHLGAGVPAMALVLVSALAGTWVYSYFRPRLPH